MPRNVNPSTLTPGGGLAPAGTVEDNSLRYPDRDVDPLRAHIKDPVRAHMASSIGIVDEGHYYTSDDVEGALQELGAGSGANYAARQNGWVAAGTSDFATAAVTAGASVTLTGSWVAITNNGLVDVSGFAITLGGGAGDYWVYLDSTTNTLVQSPTVPDITNDEDIPVGIFTYDGAGNITAQIDARFFVRNDNRKITYTVRGDGAEEDANSEGAFATIEGAFTWLQAYTTGVGGVSQKTRLTLRGAFTVTDTLTVPVDGLEIVGEDGAEITFSGGPVPLLDLDGHSGVLIQNITFLCNAAPLSTAIGNGGGDISGLIVDRCTVANGGSDWALGIAAAQGSGSDIRVTNCRVSGISIIGIGFQGPFSNVTITDNYVDGYLSAGTEPSAIGIGLASGVASGDTVSDAVVTGNTVYRCAYGITVSGLYDARAENDFTVAALPGVGDKITITDAAGFPHDLTATAGPAVATDEFLIGANVNATATNIINAINDITNTFYESVVHAASPAAGAVRLYAVPQGAVGNAFLLTATTAVPGVFTILSASFAGGFDGSVQGVLVSGNTVTNCAASTSVAPPTFTVADAGAVGIGLSFTRDCRVVDNDIREIGILIDNTGAPIIPFVNGPVENSAGITVWNSTRFAVERNTVLNTTGTSGDEQRGIYIVKGNEGAEPTFTNEMTDASVCDNKVNWSLEGNFAATPGATYGSYGIQVLTSVIVPGIGGNDSTLSFYAVNGLKVCRNEVVRCGGVGIQTVTATRGQFIGLMVDQNVIGDVTGNGIHLEIGALTATSGASGFAQTSVSGNNIGGADAGIYVHCSRNAAPNQFLQMAFANNRITGTTLDGFLFLSSVDAAYQPNVSQIDITDNEMLLVGLKAISPAPGAISFLASPADDLTVSKAFENIRVNGNSILDSGGDTAHAIQFNLTNWEPLNVEVSNNTVSGTDSNPAPGGGVRMNVVSTNATPTNYGIAGVEAAENTFFLSGTLPVGTASILVAALPLVGDQIVFNLNAIGAASVVLTAAAAPAANVFVIGGTTAVTATNIVNAINLGSNNFSDYITASIDPANASNVLITATSALPGSLATPTGPVSTAPARLTVTSFLATATATGPNARPAQNVLTMDYFLAPWAGNIVDGDTLTINAPAPLADEVYTFRNVPVLGTDILVAANAAAQATAIQTVLDTQSAYVSASFYAGSSYVIVLQMRASYEGQIGNRFLLEKTLTNDAAIIFGDGSGYFAYGEDDMINGISVEADGPISRVNITSNNVAYNNSNTTLNRRPSFVRAYRARLPADLRSPSVGDLQVAISNALLVAPGTGSNDQFTIDDGVGNVLTFQYLPPGGLLSNPAWVPINLDYNGSAEQVRNSTVRAVRAQTSLGNLNVIAYNTGVLNKVFFIGPAAATASGSITVAPGGTVLVPTTWSGGNGAAALDNDFEPCSDITICDNDFFGGIGTQIEVLNGLVANNVTVDRNKIRRNANAIVGLRPFLYNPGYYTGISLYTQSFFASPFGFPLEGAYAYDALSISDNEFTNLGYGAISVFKNSMANNLYPSLINTDLSRNKVTSCGRGGKADCMIGTNVLGLYEITGVFGVSVNDNTFTQSVVSNTQRTPSYVTDSLGTDPSCIAGQVILTNGPFGNTFSVTGNKVIGGSTKATFDGDTFAATFVVRTGIQAEAVSIEQNQVDGTFVSAVSTAGGFSVGVVAHFFVGEGVNPTLLTGGSNIEGLHIDQNQVVENGVLGGNRTVQNGLGAAGGIVVWDPTLLVGASADGNTFALAEEDVTTVGGTFLGAVVCFAADVTGGFPGTPNIIGAMSVSNNKFYVARTAVALETSGVNIQAACVGLDISGNQIVAFGQSARGIEIGNVGSVFDTPIQGMTITGNSIYGQGANPPTAVAIRTGATGPTGLYETTITGNTITNIISDATGWDTGFDFGNGGPSDTPLYSVAITGNTVKADKVAFGGVNPYGIGNQRGTCIGNVSMGTAATDWDTWADTASGGNPVVKRYRGGGATPLND